MYLNSIRCYHGLGFVGLKHVGNTVVGKLEAWKPGEFTTVNRSSITGYPSLVPDASRCWWRFSNIIGIFKPRLLAKTDPILTSFFFRWVGEKPPTSSGCNRFSMKTLGCLWERQPRF